LPPAKFVNSGSAVESMIGPGSIVSGAAVRDSVIGADVMIEDGADVSGSVLLPGVRIGKGAIVRRAILDKNVQVAPGAEIGVDLAADRQRWTVSSSGVVVLGKGEQVE
jgi:glucose-1-phosphate adenylyltransferase